jgi:hypothetical protein
MIWPWNRGFQPMKSGDWILLTPRLRRRWFGRDVAEPKPLGDLVMVGDHCPFYNWWSLVHHNVCHSWHSWSWFLDELHIPDLPNAISFPYLGDAEASVLGLHSTTSLQPMDPLGLPFQPCFAGETEEETPSPLQTPVQSKQSPSDLDRVIAARLQGPGVRPSKSVRMGPEYPISRCCGGGSCPWYGALNHIWAVKSLGAPLISKWGAFLDRIWVCLKMGHTIYPPK